jgi:hypothetical protein
MKAMSDVYHVTVPLGTLLSVVGAWTCGTGWSLALEDLAAHNKIEHDASLTHRDAAPEADYAPCKPDPALLEDMLASAPDADYLTVDDFIAYRVRRDAALRKNKSEGLSMKHKIIAFGEIALTLGSFGDAEGHVRKDFLRAWFGEERLPVDWTGPREPLGILNVSQRNTYIKGEIKKRESKKAQ